jgi:hypothetical protein
VQAALEVACAWGYLEERAVEPSLALVDRLLAMLFRMSR